MTLATISAGPSTSNEIDSPPIGSEATGSIEQRLAYLFRRVKKTGLPHPLEALMMVYRASPNPATRCKEKAGDRHD